MTPEPRLGALIGLAGVVDQNHLRLW